MKNTKINIIFGLLNKLIIIVLPFIIRTVMIHVLGAEYLGLNSLFTSILQVLNLTELGFGSAVVQSMYKPVANNDTEKICALLCFYRKIYKIIGVIIAIAGCMVIPFLPLLVKKDCPEGMNIYILYLIYLLNTSLSYFMFAYKNSILNAFQKNSVISNINSMVQFVICIIQIIILLTCKNYYFYLLMLPVASILNNVFISIYVDKKYPQYVCRGKIKSEDKKNISSKVKGLMLYKICGTSRNSFDSIFISAFQGLTVTAMYSNYYYVICALTSIAGVLTNAMLAGVGNSMELESVEKNYADMKKFDFIYMLINGWMAICLFCLYQPFIKIAFGKDMMFPTNMAFLCTLYFYELKMGDIRAMYSDAAGLWWENRYRTVVEAVVNIILNYTLVQYFGVYGIVIATLLSLLFVGYIGSAHVLYKCYFKDFTILDYFKNHFTYFSVTLFIGAITYFICSNASGDDWSILIIRAVICCIIPIILYVLIYCRTKRFQEALDFGKLVIKRK